MKKLHLFATSALACASASMSYAGGYVTPIIDVAPPVVATGASPNYWLALIPLALLYFGTRGGDGGNVTPPGDYGGPCFREGTLIAMDMGWKFVEKIKEGDMIFTSRGIQKVLSVESWTPTEYRDRPVIVDGVYLSKNHCVERDGKRVPAIDASAERDRIDGGKYFHILVQDHAWLKVKSGFSGRPILAESLMLTDDIRPLCFKFPEVVQSHKLRPCDAPEAIAA